MTATSRLLKLALILFLLLVSYNVQTQFDGCWPKPAKVQVFVYCTDGSGRYVTRCHCGEGVCDPSSQDFCDDPPQT